MNFGFSLLLIKESIAQIRTELLMICFNVWAILNKQLIESITMWKDQLNEEPFLLQKH